MSDVAWVLTVFVVLHTWESWLMRRHVKTKDSVIEAHNKALQKGWNKGWETRKCFEQAVREANGLVESTEGTKENT